MDFWKWIHVFTVNGWGKIFKGFDRLFLLLERYTKAEKRAFNKALAITFTFIQIFHFRAISTVFSTIGHVRLDNYDSTTFYIFSVYFYDGMRRFPDFHKFFYCFFDQLQYYLCKRSES